MTMSNIEQPQPMQYGDYEDLRDLHTPMMTPVNGIITNNNVNGGLGFKNGKSMAPIAPLPPYLTSSRTRQNSNSSLASSVSDFPMNYSLRQQALSNTPLNGVSGGNANFTPQFINLLMEAYQVICMDPTVTPFDTVNPPSAILNRVAKVAIDSAATREVEIGYEKNSWLLTLVRHRLLQEVRKDGYLSRNASFSSLPPAAPMFEMLGGNSTTAPNQFGNNQNGFALGNDKASVDYFNYNFAQMANQNNSTLTNYNGNNANINSANFVCTPTGMDNVNLNFANPANVITRQRSSTLSPLPSSLNIPEDSTLSIPDIFKRRIDGLRLKR